MVKKKKKIGVQYFAEREEQAVVDYINTDSVELRHEIYNKILKEPYKKMIQSILRKYPIHIGNYDINEVEANALSHLIEQMIKFRPFIIEYREKGSDEAKKWTKCDEKGRFLYITDAEDKLIQYEKNNPENDYRIFFSKGFSYCQTIVRNFYKDHSKKSYNEKKSIYVGKIIHQK